MSRRKRTRRKKDRSIEQTKAQEEKKSMTMKVRRIVTGHNASGKAIVKTDEQITAVPRVDAGISGCEIWSTDQMPIDNSSATDAPQRAGFIKHSKYVGNGGGTTFRINEWARPCEIHAPNRNYGLRDRTVR